MTVETDEPPHIASACSTANGTSWRMRMMYVQGAWRGMALGRRGARACSFVPPLLDYLDALLGCPYDELSPVGSGDRNEEALLVHCAIFVQRVWLETRLQAKMVYSNH